MAQSDFERIVVGIAHCGLVRIAAKVSAQWTANSVDRLARSCLVSVAFEERPAGSLSACEVRRIHQLQTECGIAGVGFHEREQAMSLGAHVTGAEDGVGRELALQRKHVFLGVGNAVGGGISRESTDGFVLRPIDVWVGMARRGVERRQLHREVLAALTSGSGEERSGEQRRSGTGVGGAVRRVRAENSDGERFDGGVKRAEASAQAGLPGTSEDLAEKRI